MNPLPAPRNFIRIAALLGALAGAAFATATVPAPAAEVPQRSNLRYDLDYPGLDYTTAPATNAIARLQQRLDSGALHLQSHPQRGYLDSLLQALDIDPSSQVLIYAKTSLQTTLIDPATPRALYFNDHTYVGWVRNTHFIEISTYDPRLGVMFYGLISDAARPARLVRESGRCLTCHDTYSMSGGGTPRIVVTSAPVARTDGGPRAETSSNSTDRTPVAERWGGWYVTGTTGSQKHLGNLPLDDGRPPPRALATAPRDIQSVAALFDTKPYMTDKSDVVALLVLEHQAQVHTLMTRATYKANAALRRLEGDKPAPRTWSQLPPTLQKSFLPLVEPLTAALLMEGVAGLDAPIAGSSGFDAWFQKQGPHDTRGRSLRDLDLQRQVFRYPLSYMLYTEAFDALPAYMKDYIYARIEKCSHAKEANVARRAAVEILAATKPDFARHAQASPALAAAEVR